MRKNLKTDARRVAPRSVFHYTIVKKRERTIPQGDRYLQKLTFCLLFLCWNVVSPRTMNQNNQQRTTDIRLDLCFAKDRVQKQHFRIGFTFFSSGQSTKTTSQSMTIQ
jgi:hypothetical protein